MTIALRSLAAVDSALVLTELTLLEQLLQEHEPSLDTRLGPLRDLVLYLSAAFAAQRQQQLADYLNARSLLDVNQNPAAADSDAVDAILSNFLLTRQAGTAAIGTITLVMLADVTVTIGQGSLFTAAGVAFAANATYTAKVSEDQVVADTDRLLRPVAAGFAFDIDVTAATVGAAGQLARGTALIPAVAPPAFSAAYATGNFVGGTDAETNASLVGRLSQGAAAQTISNRLTMAALLRSLPGFAGVVNSSIVGFGDAEMLRDRHWLWPVSGGGRVDWYVRTQEQVQTTVLAAVTARLIEKTIDGFGVWQFSVGRDASPGFYEVTSIVPAGAVDAAGFAIVDEFRSLNLQNYDGEYLLPDVVDIIEGAYSRFQASIVQFADTATLTTDLALGAVQLYDVTVTGLALIGDMQDALASRDRASYGADVLVRAPVPCFVQLALTLFQPTSAAAPDVIALRTALCATINQTGFAGALYASALAATIHSVVAASVTVSSIAMTGRLRRPEGTMVYLSSTEVLTVPTEPANTVARRTVGFFITPADIVITVTPVTA